MTTITARVKTAKAPALKLPARSKLILIAWGLALAQLAAPIGSAIYFLLFQVAYKTNYKGTEVTWFYLKDAWDRLPVHVQNLLHNRMFGITSQDEPGWWVTARHDFRHVLIGVIVAVLVSSVTVGLGNRKRASKTYMALSVPLAFVAAAIVAAPLIWLDTFLPPDLGVHTTTPWVNNWIGSGTLQLTLIGIITGLVVKKLVLARTMDTIQLMSIEKNVVQGDHERWWWKYAYPPTYRARYNAIDAKYEAGNYEPQPHGKAIGFVLTMMAPVFLFLLGFGIWLLYFGPAKGA